MNARLQRRPAEARDANHQAFSDLALRCARNVHRATEHRMPEARMLADWFNQSAVNLSCSDDEVVSRSTSGGSGRRGGVSLAAWRMVGAALEMGEAHLPSLRKTSLDLWLCTLSSALELDLLETEILALTLHYCVDRRVERLFDTLSECRGGPLRLQQDAALIGLLLDATQSDIAIRLTANAKLRTSGILQVGRQGDLEALERVTTLIRRDVQPEADFYEQLLGRLTAEPLPWEAFAHLGPAAEVAASVLRSAVAGNERGVNILLYGPPGTGKTSFAATLATRIGANLRSVAEADEDGDEPQRYQRLAGLRLAQRISRSDSAVLLFDEAEDLFINRSMDRDGPVTNSRVFIHRLLEQMAKPVIWTANDIGALGPSVLRRMTMCLELSVPNLATRTRLWREMSVAEGINLPDADAARLARLVPAAPAVASTALRATKLVGGDAETARLIVEGVARAIAGGALPAPEPEHDPTYDPALVNADCDLADLLGRLTRPGASRNVSFLLSGPPGTGKSAWVRYLAARMGLSVMQRRASDLLDAFVGGTERKIADAFAEARETNNFLIFDEADSLLLERTSAVRSWEISQVNEMLTWMEQHSLPFACTTNLQDRLDRASLRRFLVKVRFDWLTQTQARLAFRRFFEMPAPPALNDLLTLTPADFALVRRRAVIIETADPTELVRLLAAESEERDGGRQRIGFTAR